MIELRWLRTDEPQITGLYKLQYRHVDNNDTLSLWIDVPIAEDKPKEKSLEELFYEDPQVIDHMGMNGAKRLAKIAERYIEEHYGKERV